MVLTKTLKIVLALLAIRGAASCPGQTAPAIPPGWHLYGTGQADPAAAIKCQINGDDRKHTWAVAVADGLPQLTLWSGETAAKVQMPPGVARPVEMGGHEISLRVANGMLFGADKGEFGGGLWFAANSPTTSEPVHLSRENVTGIFPVSNGAIVITGLAHAGLNRGVVYLATTGLSGEWALIRIAELPAAPRAQVQEADSSVLVATTKQLLRVSQAGSIKVLGGLPAYLPSTSIAKTSNGAIYVGSTFFVFRFLPGSNGYSVQAMLPDACRFSQTLQSGGGTRCSCNDSQWK
jgi:hypothetical protein